ncbi:hypothetical protein AM493_11255 [Flavobacterium akiainvivens]|uniref:Outer membrane protein beta-barrel domain-containing protein n=1 Tax=Flavobacterium akiainvivens TaxID=1202724 RepID=A0A0M8MIL0_9FLAO|nr:hypothetical protein [Flavobacterium akiainvivens]KOS06547.1 hypothetical protein AM493_11255 [Flavobacterium akiainvivens]SFQ10834.1 hypothetical protein SAMN05444144_101107 [Flavobacterium akiainvivens]
MFKICVILAALLCLTSCATLYSGDTYNITLTTNAKKATAEINGQAKPLPTQFLVPHSADTLHIKLTADSLSKEYHVAPRLRPLTKYGNLFWSIPGYFLARHIDKKNGKGYYYGDYLFLDKDSTKAEEPGFIGGLSRRFYDYKKGAVNLTVSIPYINSFYLNPRRSEPLSNTGFFGLSAGVEYYYKENRFVSLSVYGATDYFFFVPVPTTRGDEFFGASALNLTHNMVFNRFIVGYGLSWAKNRYVYDYDDDWDDYPQSALTVGNSQRIERYTTSLGLHLNTYFRVGSKFHVGVIYQPYLYDLKPDGQFNYQHTISVDLLWKIRL